MGPLLIRRRRRRRWCGAVGIRGCRPWAWVRSIGLPLEPGTWERCPSCGGCRARRVYPLPPRKPWTGPTEGDLTANYMSLKHPVPPERWPFCYPEEHQTCCNLHRGGLYCDCLASDASDVNP